MKVFSTFIYLFILLNGLAYFIQRMEINSKEKELGTIVLLLILQATDTNQ